MSEARLQRPAGKGDVDMSADTRPDIEERYARMLMARAPQIRVAMCFDMSSTARAIVRRSLEHTGLSDEQIADAFVARRYGTDLSPEALAACQARIRQKRGNVPLAAAIHTKSR